MVLPMLQTPNENNPGQVGTTTEEELKLLHRDFGKAGQAWFEFIAKVREKHSVYKAMAIVNGKVWLYTHEERYNYVNKHKKLTPDGKYLDLAAADRECDQFGHADDELTELYHQCKPPYDPNVKGRLAETANILRKHPHGAVRDYAKRLLNLIDEFDISCDQWTQWHRGQIDGEHYRHPNDVAEDIDNGLDALAQTISALSKSEEAKVADSQVVPALTPDQRALLYMFEHPGASSAEIARGVGVHPKNFKKTRFPRTFKAIKFQKASRHDHSNANVSEQHVNDLPDD